MFKVIKCPSWKKNYQKKCLIENIDSNYNCLKLVDVMPFDIKNYRPVNFIYFFWEDDIHSNMYFFWQFFLKILMRISGRLIYSTLSFNNVRKIKKKCADKDKVLGSLLTNFSNLSRTWATAVKLNIYTFGFATIRLVQY